jgi:diguanylate cyclase (GGDEF)-like protein
VELASRVRTGVRAGDAVARFGGDELLVLLDGAKRRRDATRVAAELREAMSIDGNEIAIAVSVGVSVYPNDGTSSDELVRSAGAAKYGEEDRAARGPDVHSPIEVSEARRERPAGRPP